jgi:hypothetical protein
MIAARTAALSLTSTQFLSALHASARLARQAASVEAARVGVKAKMVADKAAEKVAKAAAKAGRETKYGGWISRMTMNPVILSV